MSNYEKITEFSEGILAEKQQNFSKKFIDENKAAINEESCEWDMRSGESYRGVDRSFTIEYTPSFLKSVLVDFHCRFESRGTKGIMPSATILCQKTTQVYDNFIGLLSEDTVITDHLENNDCGHNWIDRLKT